MNQLSDRQQRILEFIVDFVSHNEFPPTIREIGEEVGISSTSVVNYNLAKLEELNLIARRREVSRGLSVNWDRLEELKLVPAGVHAPAAPPMPPSTGNNGMFRADAVSLVRVPVLGAIAAGEPIMVEPSSAMSADEFLPLPEGLFSARGPLFALRVRGDSMVDASVLDGDYVVLRHQETANDGDMVAVWIEGDEETTLKYLYREGPNVRLQPANPTYDPIIRPSNRVRINGKVVYILRMLEQ
jgi:repressor LexA